MTSYCTMGFCSIYAGLHRSAVLVDFFVRCYHLSTLAKHGRPANPSDCCGHRLAYRSRCHESPGDRGLGSYLECAAHCSRRAALSNLLSRACFVLAVSALFLGIGANLFRTGFFPVHCFIGRLLKCSSLPFDHRNRTHRTKLILGRGPAGLRKIGSCWVRTERSGSG